MVRNYISLSAPPTGVEGKTEHDWSIPK